MRCCCARGVFSYQLSARRFLSFTKHDVESNNKEFEEALGYMRKEIPKAYEYYQNYLKYREEYLNLTKDTCRPLQSDDLARVAAQCGLKLPKQKDK